MASNHVCSESHKDGDNAELEVDASPAVLESRGEIVEDARRPPTVTEAEEGVGTRVACGF